MRYIYYSLKSEEYLILLNDNEDEQGTVTGEQGHVLDEHCEAKDIDPDDWHFIGTEDDIMNTLLPKLKGPQHEEETE